MRFGDWRGRGSGAGSVRVRYLFRKSTRKSAANSSRSCGTGTGIYAVAAAFVVVAAIAALGVATKWWQIKKAAEGRRSLRGQRLRSATAGKHPEAEAALRQDRRRRPLPAIASPRRPWLREAAEAWRTTIARPRSRPMKRLQRIGAVGPVLAGACGVARAAALQIDASAF